MVHLGDESNDIWYSSFDGQDWTENTPIEGQQSKASPALAAFEGRLHMVHLGDESNDIWYSSARGPRFVVLHLNELSFPAGERLEVDLRYGTDTFDGSSDQEAWTRPIDPTAGPIRIRYFGAGPNGGATLAEYGRGEPTEIGTPGDAEGSLTNVDLFLHTATVEDPPGECDPYDEPIYETRLKCGAFDWQNIACAAAGSVEEQAAHAVCCLVHVYRHPTAGRVLSTCSATLIDKNQVLTAWHCADEEDELDVDSASVVFGYETTCRGCRPDGYAPRIFKVTDKVAGNDDRDWAILEIATPPGGTGILPAVLRRSGVLKGETVVPIHHPLGAVKKFQRGTLSVDGVSQVEGFDYAGGSSGSPLFDSRGRIVGVLSHGDDDPCLVVYTAATTILDGLANPPARALPLDAMMVMDSSGSMAEPGPLPGRTKMQEARDAASLFVRLLRENAGDRIGLVSFSTRAMRPPDAALGNVNADKKGELVGPTSPYSAGIVGSLAPEGATSISDALTVATETLAPGANERAILLVTDGLQNTPPLHGIEPSLGSIRLEAIGFGSKGDLDSALLSRVARAHDGRYARASDGLDLKKYVTLAFANIFESGALLDSELELPAGQEQTEEQSFSVCTEEGITAVLGWENPSQTLTIDLRTPAGVVVTQATADVERDRGQAWHFVRVRLPLNDERAGTWHWRVRRVGGEESAPSDEGVRLFVAIIPLGGPRFKPVPSAVRVYTGDALMPQVALRHDNGTAPHADVTLEIEAPHSAVGQLVTDAGLAEPITDDDPVSGFFATLQELGGSEPYRLPTRRDVFELIDDGAHHDGAMERDGIYGNLITGLTRFEGTYRFHARARIEEPCPGERETQWALYVELGIDPRTTTVAVTETGPVLGGRRAATVVITPRDRYGNPLGPGRPEQLPISGAAGTTTGTVIDNGDGSYSVSTTWDPHMTDGPVAIASQPERPPVVLSSGGGISFRRCPRWLWALLLVLALLLTALAIILLLMI
jgi:Trypsin-like peptidase domain/von Willebrand factor type A domain